MNLANKSDLVIVLSFVYHTMRASVPLLRFALLHDMSDELREYYNQHIGEEAGHDDMLLQDLYALGVEPLPLTFFAAQFAGSQYYLIAHEHPALLLGYMRALESESFTEAEVDNLCQIHHVELSAMRHHAIHDPLHCRDIDEQIARLSASLQTRVRWNEAEVNKMMRGTDGV